MLFAKFSYYIFLKSAIGFPWNRHFEIPFFN